MQNMQSTWLSAIIVFAHKLTIKMETKRQVIAPFLTMGSNKKAITRLDLGSNTENYALS